MNSEFPPGGFIADNHGTVSSRNCSRFLFVVGAVRLYELWLYQANKRKHFQRIEFWNNQNKHCRYLHQFRMRYKLVASSLGTASWFTLALLINHQYLHVLIASLVSDCNNTSDEWIFHKPAYQLAPFISVVNRVIPVRASAHSYRPMRDKNVSSHSVQVWVVSVNKTSPIKKLATRSTQSSNKYLAEGDKQPQMQNI